MTSKEIRSRLLTGATISEICTQYDLTFDDLVKMMSKLGNEKKPNPKDKPQRTGHLYILKRYNGHYTVRKNRKHFGTYRTLEDAIKIRNWFMSERWDKRWIDRACKDCGVERCKKLWE